MNNSIYSFTSLLAGLLLSISSFLAIIIWFGFFFIEHYFLFAALGCLLSIFPLIAGILAIKKIRWKLCFICSIIGLYTLITPLVISAILASIGFVLVIISKKEFRN